MDMKRRADGDDEEEKHHIPFPDSNPFLQSNYSSSSQSNNIYNPFFLENAISQMSLQSPSPSDAVQLPNVYQYPCTSPPYINNLTQHHAALKPGHQAFHQDTSITQIPASHLPYVPGTISARTQHPSVSQSYPYRPNVSYKGNPESSFTGFHQPHCCLQSAKPSSSSSSAVMTRESGNSFSTKGCSNANKFRHSSAGRHYRKGPASSELNNNSSMLQSSQYYRHSSLPMMTRHTSLEDLRGWIAVAAKTQHGWQFLQKKFEDNKEEDIQMILLEVKDHICDLMVDPFGNFLVQKIIEVATEEQRTEVILSATKNEFELICTCLDMHGTRVMQKLLQHLTTAQQICCVISALHPGTVKLSKDFNGYHVIQHCFQLFSSEYNKPLTTKIADHCIEVATNRSGCCVLQQCVENARGEEKERLVADIMSNALSLAQDQYGNYVVQFLLGLNQPRITANILRQLEGHFVYLSRQKFSSNVVERCLKEANQDEQTQIIRELIGTPNPLMLLQDAFGNYVIQSALEVATGPVHAAIVGLVKMNESLLRSHPYGKKILSSINSSKLHVHSCPCRQKHY